MKNTLAPKLIGMNPAHMEKIHERMDAAIYGVPSAKAAIDIACYDVVGKALGIPVYDLLGGNTMMNSQLRMYSVLARLHIWPMKRNSACKKATVH